MNKAQGLAAVLATNALFDRSFKNLQPLTQGVNLFNVLGVKAQDLMSNFKEDYIDSVGNQWVNSGF